MSHSQSISIYSQLFSQQPKDDKFFRGLYTVPIHANALLSILTANCEAIGPNSLTGSNVLILRTMFVHGVSLLSDAMNYSGDEMDGLASKLKDAVLTSKDTESIVSGISTHPESIHSEFDQGGEDITALNGKGLTSSNLHFLNEYSEGEDITTLSGKQPSRSESSVSILSVQKSDGPDGPTISSLPTPLNFGKGVFDDIDEDLRFELICNILKILRIWFSNINITNKGLRKSKNSLGVNQEVDLLTILFQLPNNASATNFDESYVSTVLKLCTWYLNYAISYVEKNPALPEYKNLNTIKEIVFLLSDILKTVFASLLYHKESSMELAITESILFSFFKVDLYSVLDRLLIMTTPNPFKSEQNDTTKYKQPDISLSSETLMKMYSLISALVNVPSRYLPASSTSLGGDITLTEKESLNIYETYFCSSKEFNEISFNREINLRFLPHYAIDYNFYYNFKPDLLLNQIKSGSFMNWITGNRFNDNFYLNYHTSENITNLTANYDFFNLAEDCEYLYVDEVKLLEDHRIKVLNQYKGDEEDYIIDSNELLPMSLMLYTYVKNFTFLQLFTNQSYKVNHKIEDITPEENKYIEIYEIWLCLLSYTFQYQHKSIVLQANTQISLLILLKLTSSQKIIQNKERQISIIENIKNYQINEFKWKLCHQRLPIVPNNIGKEGFKSSLFYILDTLQIFIRFNLTKKINLFSFKLASGIIYQVLQELYRTEDELIAIDSYSWGEFYKTLTNLLLFIKKHNLVATKHVRELGNASKLKSLVEEILIIINVLLSEKFGDIIQMTNDMKSSGEHLLKSVNYELTYILLLNYHLVNDLMKEFELDNVAHLGNLRNFMKFLDSNFHLDEESKQKEENKAKIDLIDLDYDSPVLVKELSDYPKHPLTEYPDDNDVVYKYKDTFKCLKTSDVMSDSQILKVFNIAFEIY